MTFLAKTLVNEGIFVDLIYDKEAKYIKVADILEKKQRIEMARHFTHLRGGAAIDNYLAGTSQSPVGQHNTPRSQGQALPPSTLTQAEIDELTRPRAGSGQTHHTVHVVPTKLPAPAAYQSAGVLSAKLPSTVPYGVACAFSVARPSCRVDVPPSPAASTSRYVRPS